MLKFATAVFVFSWRYLVYKVKAFKRSRQKKKILGVRNDILRYELAHLLDEKKKLHDLLEIKNRIIQKLEKEINTKEGGEDGS